MQLSTFRDEVRQALRDVKATSRYPDALINKTLDKWIRAIWPKIVEQFPHHYYTYSSTITGVTDAQDADDEVYLLPTDYRSISLIRRSDLTEKPRLRYVGTQDQAIYRFGLLPFIERDPEAPVHESESWAFYDATQFRLLPAPTSTSYTYVVEYWKKHTTATADADVIDIPEDFISLAIDAVVYEALLKQEPDNERAINSMKEILGTTEMWSEKADGKLYMDVIPEMRKFWR